MSLAILPIDGIVEVEVVNAIPAIREKSDTLVRDYNVVV
jgi:hypothetical protein